MAWRPTQYLLEGILDNTQPGKVTGWMKFAGMKETVTFDLEGDFHRDIRGARIHLIGDGRENDPKAARFMEGFAQHQTGKVGDITAGLPPQDYVAYPYAEVYSDQNGRIVIELEPGQVKVIGEPIPWQDTEPISRQQQAQNMAEFLAGLSSELQVPAIAVGSKEIIIPTGPDGSDPGFSHWVVVQGQIVGEAHSVEASNNGRSFAYVRLFDMPEMAEYGYIESDRLLLKSPHSGREAHP